MMSTDAPAAHAKPSAFAPAVKIIAIGVGFCVTAFLFSLGASFLQQGAVNLEQVFNTFIKLSIACAIAGLVYLMLADKPEEHH